MYCCPNSNSHGPWILPFCRWQCLAQREFNSRGRFYLSLEAFVRTGMWAGPQCCSAAVSAWHSPSGRSSGAPLCSCDGCSQSPAASLGPGYEPASTGLFSLQLFPKGTEAKCGFACQVWRRTRCALAEAPGAFFSSKQVQHIYTHLLILGKGMSLFHLTFQLLLQLRYLTFQLFYLIIEPLLRFCLRSLKYSLRKEHNAFCLQHISFSSELLQHSIQSCHNTSPTLRIIK